jgi:hypothetical protein
LVPGIGRVLSSLYKSGHFCEKAEAEFQHYNNFCLETRKAPLYSDLYKQFLEVQQEFSEFAVTYMDLQIYLAIFKEVVEKGLDRLVNKNEILGSLLLGLGDVLTAKQDEELLEIVQEIAKNETCKKYFVEEKNLNWREIKEKFSSFAFVPKIENFLVYYGFRSKYELEVASSRWEEDPTDLLKFIQMGVQSNAPVRNKEDLKIKREDAKKVALAQQSFLTRSMYSWSVKKFQQMMRLRENCKAAVVHFIAVQRKILLGLSNQFVNNKIYKSVDDIFHLTLGDLKAIIEGNPQNLAQTIEVNRNTWLKFKSIKAPEVFFIGNDPYFVNVSNVRNL